MNDNLMKVFTEYRDASQSLEEFQTEFAPVLGAGERLKAKKRILREALETEILRDSQQTHEIKYFDGLINIYEDYQLQIDNPDTFIRLLVSAVDSGQFDGEIGVDTLLRPNLTVVAPLIEREGKKMNTFFVEHQDIDGIVGHGFSLIPVKKVRVSKDL